MSQNEKNQPRRDDRASADKMRLTDSGGTSSQHISNDRVQREISQDQDPISRNDKGENGDNDGRYLHAEGSAEARRQPHGAGMGAGGNLAKAKGSIDDRSVDSESTNNSSFLLNVNSSEEQADVQGVSLLKQIFPEESAQNLRELHHKHLQRQQTDDDFPSQPRTSYQPSSPLGKRVLREAMSAEKNGNSNDDYHENDRDYHSRVPEWRPQVNLPDDFLRLPTSIAVRRTHAVKDEETGSTQSRPRYEFIADLQQRALQEHYLKMKEYNYHHEVDRIDNFDSNYGDDDGASAKEYFSVVIHRHEQLGLGLTLKEIGRPVRSLSPENSDDPQQQIIQRYLRVHALIESEENPSAVAGVKPMDILVGINGAALILPLDTAHSASTASETNKVSLMQQAIEIIQSSPNPVVLHLQRSIPTSKNKVVISTEREDSNVGPATSLLDTTSAEDASSFSSVSSGSTSKSTKTAKKTPKVHPFAAALTGRGLIRSKRDERVITRSLKQFTVRARQWESSSAFRINAKTHMLVPQFEARDLPPEMADMFLPPDHDQPRWSRFSFNNKSLFAPSTPTLAHDSPLIPKEYLQAYYGDDKSELETAIAFRNEEDSDLDDSRPKRFRAPRFMSPSGRLRRFALLQQYRRESSGRLGDKKQDPDIFIPLYGIRKAMSTRILNTFVDDGRVAYTIWVYDVESGKEWYAPIRYFKDFCDLRAAALALASNSKSPNTSSSAGNFLSELEFPRAKAGWGFNKREAEEPEHMRQTKTRQLEHFLRGICGLVYTCQPLHPEMAEIATHLQSFLGVEGGIAETMDTSERSQFAASSPTGPFSSVPCHSSALETTRLKLKRSLQRYTYRLFLLNTMKGIVNDFVDTTRARGPKLQDVEGLEAHDRVSLKARAMKDLEGIQAFLDHLADLILDGCQEDFLSIMSRGEYRMLHDRILTEDSAYRDRLAREAVREQVEIEVYVPLRSVISRLLVNGWKNEDMEIHFKIKELRKRPQSMFRIPRDKISPSQWQSVAMILKRGVGMSTLPCSKLRAIVDAATEISRLHEQEHGDMLSGGADAFLPIFIFCVVRADMERPCALCVLLRTLCDRINRIGEIGYFLASFEAAITHIQEIDLSENREDMLSFLNVSLTDLSAKD